MRRALAILCVFLLLASGLTWPLSLHLADAAEDHSDALLNVWINAWEQRQLLSDPLRLFDANIFYPYTRTLAYSEIILPNALLGLPVTLATGNPLLSYNLVLLATFVLSGFAAYLLLRRRTGSHWAGLAAGVVFAFNAYKLSNLAQVQLLSLQWLPLALLYLDAALREAGGPRRQRRNAALLALFCVLQALSSFYYAILSGLALALYLLVFIVSNRRRLSRPALGRALLGMALASLAVLPFVLPYVQVQQELGFRRTIADSEPFSASLAQWLHALPHNLFYGALAPQSPTVIGGYPLDALFPGVVTLLLALSGLLLWRRDRLFALLLAAGAFVLSLGPTLLADAGRSMGLALPYRLLYLLPGLQALRAPVRFAALVFLALAMLAGPALAALGRRARDRGAPARFAPLALVALLALETVTAPAAQTVPVATGTAVPEVYRWLAAQPPGVILELPLAATPPERGLLNQYFSVYHWQRTPDGYSGFIPPRHGEMVYEMQTFPSARSLDVLATLDVRYVVAHTALIADWAEREHRFDAVPGQITAVRGFADAVVYELAARPASRRAQTAFYLPRQAGAGAYTVSLIVYPLDGAPILTKPNVQGALQAEWIDAAGRTVQKTSTPVSLPMVVEEAGARAVQVGAPALPGTYTLRLRARLPGLPEQVTSAEVPVSAEAQPQDEVAPVRLAAGGPDKPTYRPGETVRVSLRWQALGKIDAYYSVFARLLDSRGQAISQKDGQPANGGKPTLLWRPGEEIDDTYDLVLPQTATPGAYQLEVGMYRASDLSRRFTLNEAHEPVTSLLLGTVTVQP